MQSQNIRKDRNQAAAVVVEAVVAVVAVIVLKSFVKRNHLHLNQIINIISSINSKMNLIS